MGPDDKEVLSVKSCYEAFSDTECASSEASGQRRCTISKKIVQATYKTSFDLYDNKVFIFISKEN